MNESLCICNPSKQSLKAAVGFEPTKHHSNSFTANQISPLSYTTIYYPGASSLTPTLCQLASYSYHYESLVKLFTRFLPLGR